MRLLLDTHALIWWLAGDDRLGGAARAAMENPDIPVYVSAVSAMEVATKFRLGKLADAAELALNFAQIVVSNGFLELPLSMAHALRAGSLRADHRDPFDRMLIAQAELEQMALVSNESLFDTFGIVRLW